MIISYLIMRIFGIDRDAKEDGYIFLIVIPLLYGLYQFVGSIVQIFEKRYFDSICSFLKFVLFLSISIKLSYGYYNFLILLLVIILIAIFIFKKAWNHYSRPVLLGLLIINTMLLFTPDSSIFYFFNVGRLKWYHISSLNEFKSTGRSFFGKDDSIHGAVIDLEYKWKVNRVYNYPPAIVLAMTDPDSSWVLPVWKENKDALQHEQFHFDILEYYKILMLDSLNKCWTCKYSKKLSILDYYLNLEIKMEQRYDTSYILKDKQDIKNMESLIRDKIK